MGPAGKGLGASVSEAPLGPRHTVSLDLWMWPGPSFYQGLLLSTSLPYFITLRVFHGAKIPPTYSPGL